jgi:hypothetical protein
MIFAVVEGIDNHGKDEEWQAYRTKRIAELYEEYKDLDIHCDPILFYIVQGNAATPDELLTETAQKIIDTTTKYCGGTGWIVVPDVVW